MIIINKQTEDTVSTIMVITRVSNSVAQKIETRMLNNLLVINANTKYFTVYMLYNIFSIIHFC